MGTDESTMGMHIPLSSRRCKNENSTHPLLMMLITVPSVVLGAETAQCPASVDVHQEARDIPKGWSAYEPGAKHFLNSIEFSEGVPANRVILLPTGEQGPSVSIWTFTPSAEGYWVSCGFNDTSIVLSQRLPAETTACQVEYDRGFATPLPKRFSCTANNAR